MPAFKDEHVLIIAPGSQTTLAQLGLPESFTPARRPVPTRMFPASKKGEWDPYRLVPKRRQVARSDGHRLSADKDGDLGKLEGGKDEAKQVTASPGNGADEEVEYEEDRESDEGAVYPLEGGLVKDWTCFLAFLSHIHKDLSPPFHTPILLVTEPVWTEHDQERVTQHCFEKFKTPAFCLMDSALAVCYAFGVPLATIVDVGFEKCNVTAVIDFLVHDVGRGTGISNAGGEAMTQRLLELLRPQGWTRDMCEQLKKSSICEILPKDVPIPGLASAEPLNGNDPRTAASATSLLAGPGQRQSVSERGGESLPGQASEASVEGVDESGIDLKAVENNEGVLDVASIIASGKTAEYLARKEKEKAEKAAKKAGAAADAAAAAAKPVKLPNSRRQRNKFVYEARQPHNATHDDNEKPSKSGKGEEDTAGTSSKGPDHSEVGASTTEAAGTHGDSAGNIEARALPGEKGQARNSHSDGLVLRREVEVGIERFRAADGGILETIADTIYRTILAVGEVSKRAELWDSLIIVGNGSKVRGFKEALISTLTSKYLISPSSATIFTSELPSALSTPLATGANTPQPQAQLPAQGPNPSSHVNRLLLAATTASNPALNNSLHLHPHHHAPSPAGNATAVQHPQHHVHSSHGQTPTSIRLAKPPEYFPEWKDVGLDNAAFLGAQVAAKVVFVVDQGISKGFMTRQEYNEVGPQGIHDASL